MRRVNNYTKTTNLLKILFIFIVFLGIGYAFLDAVLNIDGDVTVTAPELNVYIQSINVTAGSTSASTGGDPTIIGNDKKEVDFSTALTNDSNSFFEETTTLVNKGSKKAYLLGIDVKVYDINNTEVTLSSPYEYTITKGDGTAVVIGEELASAATTTYKFKFNYISGIDMTTVTDYPTYTFKIVYNYGLALVCAENENITTLSANKCTENESITVSSGMVCKRAINLHQEECSAGGGGYCSEAGYAIGSTITYGNCGTSGTLTSGDAFTCDVNGDGTFDELTERFYYVSDYYDTITKTFDTTTATLVYYNNVTKGIPCNQKGYAYDTNSPAGENWHGPNDDLKLQLPTTEQWSNVSLKSSTRAILAEGGTTHDSPTTAGGTLPTAYSYSGYAARLLTAKEVMNGCGLSQLGDFTNGELDTCNYLLENTKYAKLSLGLATHLLETPYVSDVYSVWRIGSFGRNISRYVANNSDGVRPTIDVSKNKISY